MALVAALLTLAAVGALAAALMLLLRLDIALAANRQQQATARAAAHSNLTAVLLQLERSIEDGELPLTATSGSGLLDYRQTGPTGATLMVEGSSGSARARLDARIEAWEAGGGWRVRLLDMR